MGYRSDYNLSIEGSLLPVDTAQIHKSLEEIAGYKWEMWDEAELSLHDAKWYEHAEDMAKLSEAYPDVWFELHVKGEDSEEWVVDALNGLTDTRHGEMQFPPRTLWT